jgi:hypothetical protein
LEADIPNPTLRESGLAAVYKPYDDCLMLSKPFLLQYLTNAAWREISEKSGLPNEARPKIDEALHPYRAWQQAKGLIKPPADTKSDLRALANTLDQAAEQLSSALSDPRARVALINAIILAASVAS